MCKAKRCLMFEEGGNQVREEAAELLVMRRSAGPCLETCRCLCVDRSPSVCSSA